MRKLVLRLPFREKTYSICGSEKDVVIMKGLADSGGFFEPHVMSTLGAFIQPDSVCIDIGANIGAITLAMAALAKRGRIYSFEASESTFKFLNRNIRDNGLENVVPVNRAVYDDNRMLEFNYSIDEPGGSFITETGNIGGKNVRTMKIEAVRLDDWVKKNGLQKIDMIKLDVEGAEARVIKGALQTLKKFKPDLAMEFYPETLQVFQGQNAKELYDVLKSVFRGVYVIDRLDYHGSLIRVENYADLYSYIKRGMVLADVFCTHKNPRTIEGKIPTKTKDPVLTSLYQNRHPDGWSVDSRAEAHCICDRNCSAILELCTNLPDDSLPCAVRVFHSDEEILLKVTDGSLKRLKIPMRRGINNIAVEISRTVKSAAGHNIKVGTGLHINFSVLRKKEVKATIRSRIKFKARLLRQKLVRRRHESAIAGSKSD